MKKTILAIAMSVSILSVNNVFAAEINDFNSDISVTSNNEEITPYSYKSYDVELNTSSWTDVVSKKLPALIGDRHIVSVINHANNYGDIEIRMISQDDGTVVKNPFIVEPGEEVTAHVFVDYTIQAKAVDKKGNYRINIEIERGGLRGHQRNDNI